MTRYPHGMSRDVLDLAGSLGFLDELDAKFREDPNTIDPTWHEILDGQPPRPTNGQRAVAPSAARVASPVVRAPISVQPLVQAFRSRGHFAANLDPLGLLETARVVELDAATWGLADDGRRVEGHGVFGVPAAATLGEIVAHLRGVYCGSVGLESVHIASAAKRAWLAERMETTLVTAPRDAVRTRMLALLVNAEQFERFCHTKYPGTKRFSLEGSESLIPLLDLALTHSARRGAIETVLGMSHRGRLTAIEQILRRPGRELFAQFEDIEPEKVLGGSDVKYHLGFSTDRVDPNGNHMHVSLAFN